MNPFHPGQLVTVYGEFPGQVIANSSRKDWIIVLYKKFDGSQVRESVPIESVRPR